jgi:signal peptidase I
MEESQEKTRRGWAWFWREWIRPSLIILAIIVPLRSSIADWYDVPTGSMIPTILEGDRVFVNKLAYDLKLPFSYVHIAQWADPRRGDVIVFRSPADGVRLVKRVIGLPGDTLALRGNRLFVNSEAVDYQPLSEALPSFSEAETSQRNVLQESLPGKRHAVMFMPGRPALPNFGPVVVPQEHLFVMGDNRDNSNDSRFIGFIPRANVAGKATAIALSFDHKHWFAPRVKRFFHGL